MKKITVYFLIAILTMLPILSISTGKASAEKNEAMPFEIKVIAPKNQEKGIGSYYSLHTMPNQKQTIFLEIKNTKDYEITVDVNPANALTIKNGGIQYTEETKNTASEFIDPTYAMAKNIKVQNIVTLKAKETIKVPIEITTPSGNLGVYLGGISLTEHENPNDEKEGEGGFTIKNKTVVSIAIQLIMPNVDTPKVAIGDSKIEFIPSGIQLLTKFENTSGLVIKTLKGKYTVYNKDQKEVFSGKIENFKMAPKTNVYYPVFWNADNITYGDHFVVTELELNGKMITKKNTFNIPKKEVKEYAKKQEVKKPSVEKEVWAWELWVVIGVLVLIIISMFIYVIRSNRKNKEKDKKDFKVESND